MVQVTLTPEEYAAKQALLQSKGVKVTGDVGDATYDGVTVSYVYDNQTLTLTVKKKPVFMLTSMVESELKSWLTTGA